MKRLYSVLLVLGLGVALVAGSAISKGHKAYDRGWLGVSIQSVDYDIAEAFDLGIQYGAIINDIVNDSPADEAGLEEDDVIIGLDGEKVTDVDDLLDLLEETEVGDEISLTVVREGERQEIPITVGKMPKGEKGWEVKRVPGASAFTFYGSGDHGYIGVSLTDLTDQLAEYFGVDDGHGALVVEVEEDSPAEEAGLTAGDVIIAVGDEAAFDSDDIREIIEDMDAGDRVAITVVRDNREVVLDVEVAESDAFDWRFRGPDISVVVPPAPGHIYKGDFDWTMPDIDFDFDAEEFAEEMKALQEELQDLKIDLREEIDEEIRKEILEDIRSDVELHKLDRGELQKLGWGDRQFRREMDQLRKELKRLKKEIQKELDAINEKLD